MAKVAAANASKDQALSELTRAQDGAHAARVQALEAASETAKVVQESTSLRVDLSVLKATKEEALKQAEHRFASLQRDSDARIARLTTDLESSRAELSRCGSENAGLRERLEILTRQREADLAQHREEIGQPPPGECCGRDQDGRTPREHRKTGTRCAGESGGRSPGSGSTRGGASKGAGGHVGEGTNRSAAENDVESRYPDHNVPTDPPNPKGASRRSGLWA